MSRFYDGKFLVIGIIHMFIAIAVAIIFYFNESNSSVENELVRFWR